VKKKQNETNMHSKNSPKASELSVPVSKPVHLSLEANLQEIGIRVGHSSDVVIRRFTNESLNSLSMAFIFVDGLVNSEIVNKNVLQPLMETTPLASASHHPRVGLGAH
jgi:spore germination protein KA